MAGVYVRTKEHRQRMARIGRAHKGIRLSEAHIAKLKKPRKVITCLSCRKTGPISYRIGRKQIVKFCSWKCWQQYHKKKYPKLRCRCCNAEFIPKYFNKNKPYPIHCSLKCNGINWVLKQKKQDTTIERIIEKYLIKIGVDFKKQVRFGKIAIVDFLIMNELIVQCDGDYWHSLQKVKRRDIRQDLWFTNNGYKIIRFKEKDIKNNLNKCCVKIRKEIRRLS